MSLVVLHNTINTISETARFFDSYIGEPEVRDVSLIVNMTEHTETVVAAVSLKLPTFWPERAEVWFAQAEAQFSTRGVTSDTTRYHYIVQALDQDTATRVLDLLLQPPDTEKYKALKQRLLDTFTLSDAQRANLLLNMPGLGDSKPSQLMDKMLALLGDHPPCFLFHEIFLQQLPAHIRAHLVQAKLTDCRAMALAADALWTASGSSINAVQHTANATPRNNVSKFRPTFARASPTQLSTNHPVEPSGLCFFHQRFGDAARQCRPPCTFPGKGNGLAGRQ